MSAKLRCPKKYGEIEFNEKDLYPISGKRFCVDCDVICHDRINQETWQVKKVKKSR